MLNWISKFWCRNMHTQAMWPIHGRYICPQCLRAYPVAWEGAPAQEECASPRPLHNPGIALNN